MKTKSLVGAAFVVFAVSTAAAESPKYRPRYEASPEVRAKYEALHVATERPVRRGDPIAPNRGERVAEGIFVSEDDGRIMIRRKLDASQLSALTDRGVRVVADEKSVESGVIFDGAYYVAYVALPDADLRPLAGREGVNVRLVLVMTEARYYRVRDVSVAPR